MRSQSLGQNFLRNRRTARRLVHLANGPDDALCVDLGAGNGMITEAALSRGRRVLAIEVDARLVGALESRFGCDDRVSVLAADILTAPIPDEPFVVAANPPFNLSTKLVRRWAVADGFLAGALIVETAFARRVSGAYGATKLSLTLAPFVQLNIPHDVRRAEFSPQPRVDTSILQLNTRESPAVPAENRYCYFEFINYMFERGSRTLGEALKPLPTVKLPRDLRSREVRSIDATEVVRLFDSNVLGNQRANDEIRRFNSQLPAGRRQVLVVGDKR